MAHYEPFYSETFKAIMLQVTKTKAKKLFEQGKTIYLHPCKMKFDNVWQSPISVSIYRLKNEFGWDFGKYVRNFEVYNCDGERGKYAHFFIQTNNLPF